jgi:adenylate cyclase
VEPGQPKRKLAAILHADVVAFSRLMGEDEAGTHRALGELRRAVDPVIAEQGGRIVGTAGDSLLADFPSVIDALACAVEMQRVARAVNEPVAPGRRLEFRIGVNLGDVIVDGGDIFGDGVNIAARLQALAKPGGVCISQTVYEQVRHKLDLDYRPLGSHRVKNIAEPIRAYAVGQRGAAAGRLAAGRQRRPLAASALAALAALVIAAGLIVWTLGHGGSRSEAGRSEAPDRLDPASLAAPARMSGRPSVAVLPFKDLSEDPGQVYFSDGVTEDIIAALGRFSNLLVSSKSATLQFKDRSIMPAEIGRALDARYLVDGSIRRAGERLRVNVELIESASGRLLWSERYDGELKDIFAVQDDIARRVVGAVAVRLTHFEQDRVLAKPTESLVAYEYVLRGREYFSNATRDKNDEARRMFERAIELDPNYAAAYAALGGAYYEAVVSGWTELPDEDLERAESLAQKALALDASTTSAYRLLGFVELSRQRYDLALAQIDRALKINPNDAESYAVRGVILVWSGKAAEALPWLEAALHFDRTVSNVTMNLGMARYFLGKYSDAVEAFESALARNPGRLLQITAHAFLAAAYGQIGSKEDAERERANIARLTPLFDAERFALQFGTEEARDQVRDGLRKAGFRQTFTRSP